MIKKLIVILIITSLVGYLEWGGNNKMFVAEGELDILHKLFQDPLSVIHPFTLLPLLGQLFLLITLLQKRPKKWMILTGITGIGLLYLMILITGIFSKNPRIIISSLPFLLASAWMIRTLSRSMAV